MDILVGYGGGQQIERLLHNYWDKFYGGLDRALLFYPVQGLPAGHASLTAVPHHFEHGGRGDLTLGEIGDVQRSGYGGI